MSISAIFIQDSPKPEALVRTRGASAPPEGGADELVNETLAFLRSRTRPLGRPQQSSSPARAAAAGDGTPSGPGSWGAGWVVGSLPVEVGRRRLLSRPCGQQPARSLAAIGSPGSVRQRSNQPHARRSGRHARVGRVRSAPARLGTDFLRVASLGPGLPTSRRRSERPTAPGRVVRRCSAPGFPRCSYDSAASAPPRSAFAPW